MKAGKHFSGCDTKLAKLTALMRAGDWEKALALAANFHELGEQKGDITRAHNAAVSPGFYRQIKQDPATLVELGIAALKARYPFWEEVPK